MVSPSSRWTATPLLILLLSSTTYAQYTLRGRVVQDHQKRSLGRRAEPAASPSESGTDQSGAGGDDGDTAGPEASSSTYSDKGDEGDTAPGDDDGDDGDDNATTGDSDKGGGGNNALYLVSHEDFCVYGPSEANTPINSVGDNVVSWCTKDHGSKTIPEGTLSGVTYVKTPNYVQVSGYGDFTKINIAAGDSGGQFDSSEHTPSGAQLLLGADKSPASNWVTLIGHDTFCVRACTGDPQYCPTQYDTLGCYFLTNDGVGWPNEFQDCEGEDGGIPGVFAGKTYTVGQGTYPPLVAPSVSNCNGGGAGGPAPTGSDHKATSTHEPGKSSAHGSSGSSGPSGSGSASSSEQWLPVETCVPCAGAGSGSASSGGPSSGSAKPSSTGAGSTPALSGTIEVGMSQLQTGGSLAGGASAIAGSPTTAPQPGGDALVQKRQAKSAGGDATDTGGEGDGGEDGASSSGGGDGKSDGGGEKTVTKGDQCCFTTWTPAAGGAKATGTGTGTATGTGAGKVGATTGPFSGMSNAAPSGSKALNGTGVAGVGNKTAGAVNGTGNGTDSGAGSWRGEALGMEGLGKIVGGLIIGLIGGGWLLV